MVGLTYEEREIERMKMKSKEREYNHAKQRLIDNGKYYGKRRQALEATKLSSYRPDMFDHIKS